MQYLKPTFKFSFFLSCLFLTFGNVSGQNTTFSPYSRYGLGELNDLGFAKSLGLGGLTLSLNDPFELNISNPASYSTLKKPSFEVGIESKLIGFKTNTEISDARTTGIRYFAFGFPINKTWGMSFGLIPRSSIGYNMTNSETVTDAGNVEYRYNGDGGINQIYFGNGIKLYKSRINVETKKGIKKVKNDSTSLAIGVNAYYLFGTLNHYRRVIFNQSGYLNTKVSSTTLLSDGHLDGSLMYTTYLVKDKLRQVKKSEIINRVEKVKNVMQPRGYSVKLNTSVSYGLGSEIKGTQDYMVNNYFANVFNIEFPRDTIEYENNTRGSITLPQTMSFGVSFDIFTKKIRKNKKKRYLIGAQYQLQNWSEYSSAFGDRIEDDNLTNSSQLSVGFQYAPRWKGNTGSNVFDLSEYRIGFRSSNSYLQLNGTQLQDNGISFGIGIPVIKSGSFSKINLGVELGKRGTTDKNLIEENYARFMVGLSLSPNLRNPWFVKNKYN